MAKNKKERRGEKKERSAEPVVPPAPLLNPYAHLRRQAAALLRLESVIHPNNKTQCQWQLLQEFCNVTVLVGKGGANTMYLVLNPQGGGKRNIGFPADIMKRLERLANQSHWLYQVEVNGKRRQLFSIRKTLKREPPVAGAKIWGITRDGAQVVYVARQNATGKIAWIKK